MPLGSRRCLVYFFANSLPILLLLLLALYSLHNNGQPGTEILAAEEETCNPSKHVPCVYKPNFDLRIIVLTYNRSKSLKTCLDHLQKLELDGDTAEIVIWIDRSANNSVNKDVLNIANSFLWKQGSKQVRIQDTHVGIYGQWIYTWRPSNDDNLAIILEDDIDLSPFAYRWAKKVNRFYENRTDYLGAALTSELYLYHLPHPFKVNDTLFFFRHFYTWGFAPKPSVWRKFQDWYIDHLPRHRHFKPYVPNVISTEWYKIFEKKGTQHNMWSMWFLYYSYIEQLFCAFSNTDVFGGPPYLCLARHRYEVGLHFAKKIRKNYCRMLQAWMDRLAKFPVEPVKFEWNGKRMGG